MSAQAVFFICPYLQPVWGITEIYVTAGGVWQAQKVAHLALAALGKKVEAKTAQLPACSAGKCMAGTANVMSAAPASLEGVVHVWRCLLRGIHRARKGVWPCKGCLHGNLADVRIPHAIFKMVQQVARRFHTEGIAALL